MRKGKCAKPVMALAHFTAIYAMIRLQPGFVLLISAYNADKIGESFGLVIFLVNIIKL
jgi:hypothetical protein